MKVEKTPEGRPVGESARDARGFPWRLPTTSRASGRLSLNKGGSQGRARCAQVRPWRPSQDGQRPRTPCSPAPDAGIPPLRQTKTPVPQATHAPPPPMTQNHTSRKPQRPRAALTGWRSAAPRRARPPATDACSARWYGSTGSGLDSLPPASRRPPP